MRLRRSLMSGEEPAFAKALHAAGFRPGDVGRIKIEHVEFWRAFGSMMILAFPSDVRIIPLDRIIPGSPADRLREMPTEIFFGSNATKCIKSLGEFGGMITIDTTVRIRQSVIQFERLRITQRLPYARAAM